MRLEIVVFERAVDRIEMRGRHDLGLDVLCQQTDRPARMTGRRLGAGQRGQLGLRFVIKNRRNWRCFALLARKDRIKPLGHERLAHTRRHGQVGVECLDDLRVKPTRAALGLIRLQQKCAP